MIKVLIATSILVFIFGITLLVVSIFTFTTSERHKATIVDFESSEINGLNLLVPVFEVESASGSQIIKSSGSISDMYKVGDIVEVVKLGDTVVLASITEFVMPPLVFIGISLFVFVVCVVAGRKKGGELALNGAS